MNGFADWQMLSTRFGKFLAQTCFRVKLALGTKFMRRWAAMAHLILIVTVLAVLPSTVKTTLTSPRPIKLRGNRTFA